MQASPAISGRLDAGGIQNIVQHHAEVLPLDAGVRVKDAVAAAVDQPELVGGGDIGVVAVAERLLARGEHGLAADRLIGIDRNAAEFGARDLALCAARLERAGHQARVLRDGDALLRPGRHARQGAGLRHKRSCQQSKHTRAAGKRMMHG